MSTTGLASFDTTIHTSNIWVNDVATTLGWEDKHKAFQALRVTLHILRDRLTVDEVANLGSQLPVLIAGFYYENWQPATHSHKERTKEGFLAPIQHYFHKIDPDIDPEQVARAVFLALAHHVSKSMIEDIAQMFPKDLRELWTEALQV